MVILMHLVRCVCFCRDIKRPAAACATSSGACGGCQATAVQSPLFPPLIIQLMHEGHSSLPPPSLSLSLSPLTREQETCRDLTGSDVRHRLSKHRNLLQIQPTTVGVNEVKRANSNKLRFAVFSVCNALFNQ